MNKDNKALELLAEDLTNERFLQDERIRLLQEIHDKQVWAIECRHRISVQVILVSWLLSVVGMAILGGFVKWS